MEGEFELSEQETAAGVDVGSVDHSEEVAHEDVLSTPKNVATNVGLEVISPGSADVGEVEDVPPGKCFYLLVLFRIIHPMFSVSNERNQ